MSREGIYGGEQNIWAAIGGQHYCALPFTRLISGHADFTGGYFGHEPKLRGSSWTLKWLPISFTRPPCFTGSPTLRTWKLLSRRIPLNGKLSEHPFRMGGNHRPSAVCHWGNALPSPGGQETSGTLL